MVVYLQKIAAKEFGGDKRKQLFSVGILPLVVYLQKIAAKEFGGDKRKLDFQEFLINGITASVKVKSTGEKMSMVSLLTLVQDDKGSWKIVEDAPVIIQ